MTCVVPLHQIWSSALLLCSAAISATSFSPKIAYRSVSHPWVPKYFLCAYDNVKSKEQNVIPGTNLEVCALRATNCRSIRVSATARLLLYLSTTGILPGLFRAAGSLYFLKLG